MLLPGQAFTRFISTIGIAVALAVLPCCKKAEDGQAMLASQLTQPRKMKRTTVGKRSRFFARIEGQSLDDIKAMTVGALGHECKKLPKKKLKVLPKQFRCGSRSLAGKITFYQCDDEESIREQIRLRQRRKAKKDDESPADHSATILILAKSDDGCKEALKATLAAKAIQAKAMIEAFQNILDDDYDEDDY